MERREYKRTAGWLGPNCHRVRKYANDLVMRSIERPSRSKLLPALTSTQPLRRSTPEMPHSTCTRFLCALYGTTPAIRKGRHNGSPTSLPRPRSHSMMSVADGASGCSRAASCIAASVAGRAVEPYKHKTCKRC